MYRGKKILALIPARGQSAGLPRKNIKPLFGKPLLAWTIEAGRRSRHIDRLILSSDDAEIIETAKRYGCETPFVRPAHLATAEASMVAVAIDAIERAGRGFDHLVLLQPTSPLRRPEDIDRCIERCIDEAAPSVVTVAPLPKPAGFYGAMSADGSFSHAAPPGSPGGGGTACLLNGAVYVAAIGALRREGRFVMPGTRAHLMPIERSCDIDSLFDLMVADLLLPYLLEEDGVADATERMPERV